MYDCPFKIERFQNKTTYCVLKSNNSEQMSSSFWTVDRSWRSWAWRNSLGLQLWYLETASTYYTLNLMPHQPLLQSLLKTLLHPIFVSTDTLTTASTTTVHLLLLHPITASTAASTYRLYWKLYYILAHPLLRPLHTVSKTLQKTQLHPITTLCCRL